MASQRFNKPRLSCVTLLSLPELFKHFIESAFLFHGGGLRVAQHHITMELRGSYAQGSFHNAINLLLCISNQEENKHIQAAELIMSCNNSFPSH